MSAAKAAKPPQCPICDTPIPGHWQDYPEYPFCTRRCKLIDLGRWLSEDYKIPTPDDDDSRSTSGER